MEFGAIRTAQAAGDLLVGNVVHTPNETCRSFSIIGFGQVR